MSSNAAALTVVLLDNSHHLSVYSLYVAAETPSGSLCISCKARNMEISVILRFQKCTTLIAGAQNALCGVQCATDNRKAHSMEILYGADLLLKREA